MCTRSRWLAGTATRSRVLSSAESSCTVRRTGILTSGTVSSCRRCRVVQVCCCSSFQLHDNRVARLILSCVGSAGRARLHPGTHAAYDCLAATGHALHGIC